MTKEEAIKLLKVRIDLIKAHYPDIDDYREALEMAIEALGHEFCEDAISRQAVLDEMGDINMDIYTDEVKDIVNALPSVILKTGNWIQWTDDRKDYCSCSECGYGEEGEVILGNETPYCPICGAKMESEE